MLKAYLNPDILECGCDEAGRGCLAGPVFAAAVILPENCNIKEINDSKKLNKLKRESLYETIKEVAIDYHVAMILPKKIDRVNILNASFLAMEKAILHLDIYPEFLLIDGHIFRSKNLSIPYKCIIKGDSTYMSIAAASILAKVERDKYMINLDLEYPQYDWVNNKGYPTLKHRKAIKEYGLSKHHRKSFKTKKLI